MRGWREGLTLILTAAQGVACVESGNLSPSGPEEPPVYLVAISGSLQMSVPGEILGDPLVVQALRGGVPAPSVRIAWQVTAGTGRFVPTDTTLTDGNGLARVWLVPSSPRATVQASVATRPGMNTSEVSFRTTPRATAVYARVSPSSFCSGTVCERIHFYPDQTFDLVYWSGVVFGGSFSHQGPVADLSFAADPEWRATASARGDTLLVRYNLKASMSDFEDGTFVLRSGQPPLP